MIATGPKPPLSFNSSNDEAPIKLNIGGGMGEQQAMSLLPGCPAVDARMFERRVRNLLNTSYMQDEVRS